MTSPTIRSLALLKKQGYTCQVVEKWNPFAHIRQDLFGCIDIVAVRIGETGVLGIQATSDGNISHRIAKVAGMRDLEVWLKAGNRFIVWGWGLKGPRGGRKVWTLREQEVKLNGEQN